jgi:hypothetical protein
VPNHATQHCRQLNSTTLQKVNLSIVKTKRERIDDRAHRGSAPLRSPRLFVSTGPLIGAYAFLYGSFDPFAPMDGDDYREIGVVQFTAPVPGAGGTGFSL